MNVFSHKINPSVSADDQLVVATVADGREIPSRIKLEDGKVRNADGTSYTLAQVADAALPGATATATAAALVGAVNAPASGTLTCSVDKQGNFFTLTFALTAVRLTVTDAAGSGSSGSHKLFDFVQSGVVALACRQNYTAFAEGAALTGGAGDAAFVMGLGSAAANAGDGALTGTEVDFGAATSTITLSSGTGTGTAFSATPAALDGTTTAVDLYLNWSGTAATIDANSTIDVTGTITVAGILIGDD